jgi:transposase-like protein
VGAISIQIMKVSSQTMKKRLTFEQKKEIWRLHQSEGLSSRAIASKIGCSFVTVCYYIRQIRLTGEVPQDHLPMEPRKRRTDKGRKLMKMGKHRSSELEKKWDQITLQLFRQYKGSPKVQEELSKLGLSQSHPTILKRMRRAATLEQNP